MQEELPYKTWEYEEQTKIKHAVLSKYLDKWFTILGSNHKLNYIDGFCGIGAYQTENKTVHFGSPVLAIFNYENQHKHAGKRINFLFCDQKQSNLENVKSILKHKNCKSAPVYKCGDFDTVINELLDKAPKLAPTFILIDPFGYKGVKINTIKRIMERDKTEIVLNFMFTRINEFLSHKKLEAVFQELFGSCDWKSLTKLQGSKREKALISLYRNQLKQHGKIQYVYPYPIEFPKKKRTYYYLFHLTNYWKACSIMKSVFSEINYNRLVFQGNRTNQLSFMDISSYKEADLRDYLVSKYKQETISYLDLIKKEIDEVPYTETDIRKLLKKLENKELVVQRITSKTPRGLQENDLIIFKNLLK